jgi:hypothetical protein
MSETRARGRREQTQAGGIILTVISCLSAVLVIAGLIYATGTGGRDEAALAAAGCEPGLSSDTQPCTTQPMLISQYMAILAPASRQLNIDVAAYTASEGDNLAAAEAALTAEVTSEQAFDTNLAGIEFPPAIVPIAEALVRADQARAKLTAEQARSSTLTQLRSFNSRVQVASTAVATEMKLILNALHSPPRRS